MAARSASPLRQATQLPAQTPRMTGSHSAGSTASIETAYRKVGFASAASDAAARTDAPHDRQSQRRVNCIHRNGLFRQIGKTGYAPSARRSCCVDSPNADEAARNTRMTACSVSAAAKCRPPFLGSAPKHTGPEFLPDSVPKAAYAGVDPAAALAAVPGLRTKEEQPRNPAQSPENLESCRRYPDSFPARFLICE